MVSERFIPTIVNILLLWLSELAAILFIMLAMANMCHGQCFRQFITIRLPLFSTLNLELGAISVRPLKTGIPTILITDLLIHKITHTSKNNSHGFSPFVLLHK